MSESALGLIVANWKLNGSLAMLNQWCQQYAECLAGSDMTYTSSLELVICPPVAYLSSLHEAIAAVQLPIKLGAQDVSAYDTGAYTGEVSAVILADLNVEYGIVGHSERRTLFAEADEQVGLKAAQLLAAGITPIVCVGESAQQRESGETFSVLERQLHALLVHVPAESLMQCVIAYEPVWAIGTGQTATAKQANDVHRWIHEWLAVQASASSSAAAMRVIYGGSVKPANAAELLAQPDIAGALVGGASLQAESFFEISQKSLMQE